MMKFLTPVIVTVAVIGGSGLAHFLAPSAAGEAVVKSDKADEASKAKHDSHGKETSAPKDVAYFKFSREFVVPIMRDQRVSSLVIININLESSEDGLSKLFSLEPKLRDNIMTTLIKLSNERGILDSATAYDNYETIRATILKNLGQVSSEVHNVLILDMAKQDL